MRRHAQGVYVVGQFESSEFEGFIQESSGSGKW